MREFLGILNEFIFFGLDELYRGFELIYRRDVFVVGNFKKLEKMGRCLR